jgi:hypothetical protein
MNYLLDIKTFFLSIIIMYLNLAGKALKAGLEQLKDADDNTQLMQNCLSFEFLFLPLFNYDHYIR